MDTMEFEAKTIDEAIEKACDHYQVERDKLEVTILQDSSSGIFGLGAKKALIEVSMCDNSHELKALVTQVVERLVSAIAEPVRMSVEVDDGRVKVTIEDDENSGLLIGREGQTLQAIQYLANRIISKRWRDPVRVHIDTGDYRERQDDSLRQLAWSLAGRVVETGRPQSTRPLTSYHRRVVHMALQEDETVVTRSKGEGPLKRVLILPKREQRENQRTDTRRAPGNRPRRPQGGGDGRRGRGSRPGRASQPREPQSTGSQDSRDE